MEHDPTTTRSFAAIRQVPLVAAAAEIDPLELYATGIDTSDFVAKVGPLLRAAVPSVGDLLDIGAGGGQLGQALRDPSASWTAIEPAAAMQRRLSALTPPPRIIPMTWRRSDLPHRCADTALAANIAAPLSEADDFLHQCRAWARRNVVWIVPAQQGPRGLCLAGCLPQAWHSEDETPGVDIVLSCLRSSDRPDIAAQTDWTFSVVVQDLAAIATYLANRLGWTDFDPRRPLLLDHLAARAVSAGGGHRLSIPRRSAILVWRATSR